ncbi:MAG: MMPL family transporter [Prevotellaceae bacterium]|jgi:1-acyl-sn-glycerol-3-phosphate acyltransferase|nr:MMPL family transporter [Prevotellaceae bacterium]
MSKFFVGLYNFFQKHKALLYLSLAVFTATMVYCALQVKFDENIAHFFPNTKDTKNISKVFDNLDVKDKIIVMFTASDSIEKAGADELIAIAETFGDELLQQTGNGYIKDILLKIDDDLKKQASDFVYDNLPLFLSEEDYLRIDSLLFRDRIAGIMYKNYLNLISPAGIVMKEYIVRDPLGLGTPVLKYLQNFQPEADYQLYDNYIFSNDGNALLMFITPANSMGNTDKNEVLVNSIEDGIVRLQNHYPLVRVEYFGGPSVGVYNARQIKADTLLTVLISLLVIIVFMSLVFQRKVDILLIITPAIFGALFSLCFIYLIKGSISAIAVGAGAMVLGIALSYSIHMIAHQNHVSSSMQLIRELAYPLTVGSFTTIGAFLGLLFTNSGLLHDLGLFAALALIGTTLFCLVYLPHFLNGQIHQKQNKILRAIERVNAYPFEKNKGLIGGILLVTVICLFTSRFVCFESDMTSLSYEPKHLKQTEQRLAQLFNKDKQTVLFVTIGNSLKEAIYNYAQTNTKLAELKDRDLISDYASAGCFLVSAEEQRKRLQKWENFWTVERKNFVKVAVELEGENHGFREGTFNRFYTWLDSDFKTLDANEETTFFVNILGDWQSSVDSLHMLISQVRLNNSEKEKVYESFKQSVDVVIFDRAYFASKWVSAVNDDFYLVLFISSFLIFFALLISYGRIELTLISFLPMAVSWVIIVGIMGILGIQFNIINIILSTFIFGIGDDFSIFIMDGLQSKYRTGKKVLNSHKTAIFFSAFTIIVGMGAMVFAKHPALQSISYMSILGIVVVVLVAYTLEPVIFNFFIAHSAAKGRQPYTMMGILQTVYAFSIFLTGCILLRLTVLLLYLVPVKRQRKKQWVCRLIMYFCRGLVTACFFIRKKNINLPGETFEKPSIIIANHQSFIDILRILSLNPRILLMTNKWVWYSPFFGAVIRYADYFYVGEGYENYLNRMRRKIEEGYSIAVFPEGTRSYDEKINRFHKGAFHLAGKLGMDILPVLLYGNGMVLSKAQPFYLKGGIIATKILPRISCNNISFGDDLRSRTKNITTYMRSEYSKLYNEYSSPDNKYFYNALIKNYIYKGPVEEWYARIKVSMEGNYCIFNELIPRNAYITDIGCSYGMLDYMLVMLSPERKVLGIDYDEDKIDVARHGYLHTPQTNFVYADILNYTLPDSDVFVMNDVLHYLDYDNQHSVLKNCIEKLNHNGLIIVRDGNANEKKKQRLTRFTEILSTRIFRFNKTQNDLHFTSTEQMESVANKYNMSLKIIKNDRYTSNTIYLFRKK